MKTRHTIIIAEIGVNHDGSLDAACRMIREAAEAGADYVKFQTFRAEALVCASAQRAAYQEKNCGGNESQLQMLRRYELSADNFKFLAEECRRHNIGFLSSAFDMESITLLEDFDMDYWKIPSGEITNLPYLRAVARTAKKIILSTGMSSTDEIQQAIEALEREGFSRQNITLLHCNTQYPTPMADVNLLAMQSLREFSCGSIGYSDHTMGITVPTASVALGAEMIEKHFTLDKTLPGPDHKASADPTELRAMVSAIREVEAALGSANKCPSESELPNRAVARKSIVASRVINRGEKFTEENITTKRPGTGLSPMLWDRIIGTVATRDFLPDELIEI